MSHSFIQLLSLLGSLGLFLYGMKLLSESLQKIAGNRIRPMLTTIPSNPVKGVLLALLVTIMVQSSSATTVMVVSFVNAGLISLVQSVGLIMGANIGTTFTAWIISLLGFQLNIIFLALPLIGVGFPLLFSRRSSRKAWGELIVGFAIIFLGLDFLRASFSTISQLPEAHGLIAGVSEPGIYSTLLFVAIGAVLTLLVRSSTATIVLTMVMCSSGWISFELGAAMVLGQNIGTTITANLAASVANVLAKRAARVHLIFNLIGAVWALLFFSTFTHTIGGIAAGMSGVTPSQSPESAPIALSLFHTAFNLVNTLVLIWFTPLIAKLATRLVPSKDSDDEEFRLQHIGIGLLSTSELSLIQANKEIVSYAKRAFRMFGMVKELFRETNDKNFWALLDRIEKYETISDRVEVEIATYLSKVSSRELSEGSMRRLLAMFKIISNIESISDSSYNLARTLRRKKQASIWFNQEVRDNINHMFALLDDAFAVMLDNLSQGRSNINLESAYEAEARVNQYRNKLRDEHIANVEKNQYKYQAGVIYNDLFSESEKLADYIINVSEDIAEVKKPIKQ